MNKYYISSTDNYPTTQYCKARSVTIPEFIDFVKSKTIVVGAEKRGTFQFVESRLRDCRGR
jgi:hypothetical protein